MAHPTMTTTTSTTTTTTCERRTNGVPHPAPVPNGGPCGAAGESAASTREAFYINGIAIWYEALPIGAPAPGPCATGAFVFHHVSRQPAAGRVRGLGLALGRHLAALTADGRRYVVRQGPVRRLPGDGVAEHVQVLLVLLLDPFTARAGEHVAPDGLPLSRGTLLRLEQLEATDPVLRLEQSATTDLVLRRLALPFEGRVEDAWQRLDDLPGSVPVPRAHEASAPPVPQAEPEPRPVRFREFL